METAQLLMVLLFLFVLGGMGGLAIYLFFKRSTDASVPASIRVYQGTTSSQCRNDSDCASMNKICSPWGFCETPPSCWKTTGTCGDGDYCHLGTNADCGMEGTYPMTCQNPNPDTNIARTYGECAR